MKLLAASCAIAAAPPGVMFNTLAPDAAKPQPIELLGIENAFRITDRIVSGSQPKLDGALKQTSQRGAACHKAYRNERSEKP